MYTIIDRRKVNHARMDETAQAAAFQHEADGWNRTLDAHGHWLESTNRGETVLSIEPRK